MPATLSTVAYVGATILFILSLGGLSNPETSRRGNLYGMIGMGIAVLATAGFGVVGFTDTSPGTEIPRSRSRASTPSAMMSL